MPSRSHSVFVSRKRASSERKEGGLSVSFERRRSVLSVQLSQPQWALLVDHFKPLWNEYTRNEESVMESRSLMSVHLRKVAHGGSVAKTR